MNYDMAKFGSNITSDENAGKLADEILEIFGKNESIDLDFKNISLMTTTVAKEIFKPIVDKYGLEKIFKKIRFCNVAEDLKIVISTAIDNL